MHDHDRSLTPWDALFDAARSAAANAYCPYSNFPVGAAVLMEDARIFAGCNVENASYGLTLCAERSAIVQAIANGTREIRAIAVYTPTANPTAPCGACRQFIREFGDDIEIVGICDGESVLRSNINLLLPQSFSRSSLPEG